jgi:hypothetical protein
MARPIILYELNEVPFRIVDAFRQWRPDSALARRLDAFSQFETVAEEAVPLSPWITWPTLHRGVRYETHAIKNFGQDLSEVNDRFPPIWALLTRAGVRCGVYGSFHTYPLPADRDRYAFYVPDVFSHGSETHPSSLEPFQEFNLAMSRASARNVSRSVDWRLALRMIPTLPALGLRLGTMLDLGRQLLDERRNPARRVRRRTYQTVLAFDGFMKQLRKTRPGFCTFFTNHVASSMHRYWAAAFPGDYDRFDYDEGWVERWCREIEFAMGKFDEELDRLLAFVDRNPEHVLLVASSMGQAATETKRTPTRLYVTDVARFMSRLGLADGEWESRPAMLPDHNVVVRPEKVDRFRGQLQRLRVNDKDLVIDERENGFFSFVLRGLDPDLDHPYARLGDERIHWVDLGIKVEQIEDQANDNAYHVPEGILLRYDPQDDAPDRGRTRLATTAIAPALLQHFGVAVPDYMPQHPGLTL